MRLLSQSTIGKVGEQHADARAALADWVVMVKAADWRCFDDVVRSSSFPARAIENGRVIFNIKGNSYRLVCGVRFQPPIVYVKWFGTHAEYDKIDAANATMRF